jgi:solute carrier family 13 (sodium-dependent dicarboxylate transporter), member 2/3/5
MDARNTWALVGGPTAACAVGAGLYVFGDLPRPACATAAVTTLCALWWITGPIPIAATAMAPFALFPLLGVLTHRQVAAAYGDTIILLFLGGFLLSAAMEKSGAHRRLALGMVRAVGGVGGRRMVFGFMLAAAALSMWISNTATALMLLPIAAAVLRQAGDESQRLSVPLLLGIAYGASIGGVGTLVGTPPNGIFLGVYAEQTGIQWNFLQWMRIGVPVVVVMLPLSWLWLTRGMGEGARLSIPRSGPWRTEEVGVLIVFGCTAIAWMSRPFWAGWLERSQWVVEGTIGDSTVAMTAAVLLFIIPNGRNGRLLDWNTAQNIPWGLLLLFGGGIAIARAFTDSGLSQTMGDALSGVMAWPTILMILVICLGVTFLTEITSNTATTTMLMPVLAVAAFAAKLDPAVLMIPAALSASFAFMLPVATPPNAVVMSTGDVTIRRMAREGFMLNLLGAAVITGVCWLLVPRG